MATKARLHWFWRGGAAVLAGLFIYVVWLGMGWSFSYAACEAVGTWLTATGLSRESAAILANAATLVAPAMVGAIAAYGMLRGHGSVDGELHCRRCHHILRGLSEPRCPECGEPI